jgi:hypothetical protein
MTSGDVISGDVISGDATSGSGMCMQYMTAFSMFFRLVGFFVDKMLFIIRGFTLYQNAKYIF